MGISFDSTEANQAFARKYDFDYPLLSDTSRSIGLAYGACDDPSARSARRISYWIGPDGVVKKAYPKVDAARQPEDLLTEIEA